MINRIVILIIAAIVAGTAYYIGSYFITRNRTIAILQAAKSGDIVTIERILDTGYDVNRIQPFKQTPIGEHRTPLIVAVRSQQYAVVQYLLSRGADPNQIGPYHEVPVLDAAGLGNWEIFQLLTTYGADLRGGGKYATYYVPLSMACQGGNIDIIKYVLKYCTVGNVFAIMHRTHKDEIPTESDERRRQALFQALNDGGIQSLILSGEDLDAVDADGRTLLHHAVIEDLPDAVSALLLHGVNRTLRDHHGYTAEDLAVKYGRDHLLPGLTRNTP